MDGGEWQRLRDLVEPRWPGWLEASPGAAVRPHGARSSEARRSAATEEASASSAAATIGRARASGEATPSPRPGAGDAMRSASRGIPLDPVRVRAVRAALAGSDLLAFFRATAEGEPEQRALQIARARPPTIDLGPQLAGLLGRLIETADYSGASTRAVLARRAQALIKACAEDADLLATCRMLALVAPASGDQVQLAFDEMTLARTRARLGGPDASLQDIARFGRGSWRLEILRQEANALARQRPECGDALELGLALQVRLRDSLDLPTAATSVHQLRRISPELVAAFHDVVLAKTSNAGALGAYLDRFEPWKAAIERQPELEAVRASFVEEQEALDAAMFQQPGESGAADGDSPHPALVNGEQGILDAWGNLVQRREAALAAARRAVEQAAIAALDLTACG